MGRAWDDFMVDLERYALVAERSRLGALLLIHGAQAGMLYRFGHSLFIEMDKGNPFIKILAYVFYAPAARFIEIVTGITLQPKAQVGRGLYIGHFGGIIIGSEVKMGDYCNVAQGVTIGRGGRRGDARSPLIGNRVFIGPGAMVLGDITVGDDVVIGANAVVVRSVPPRAVVVGVPAKIVSYKGSFDFIEYAGMENDPERQASLALSSVEEQQRIAAKNAAKADASPE